MYDVSFRVKEIAGAYWVQLVRKECHTLECINGSIVDTFIGLARVNDYDTAYKLKNLFDSLYLDTLED